MMYSFVRWVPYTLAFQLKTPAAQEAVEREWARLTTAFMREWKGVIEENLAAKVMKTLFRFVATLYSLFWVLRPGGNDIQMVMKGNPVRMMCSHGCSTSIRSHTWRCLQQLMSLQVCHVFRALKSHPVAAVCSSRLRWAHLCTTVCTSLRYRNHSSVHVST